MRLNELKKLVQETVRAEQTKENRNAIVENTVSNILQEGAGWNSGYGGGTHEGFALIGYIAEELEEKGIVMDPEFWETVEEGLNLVEKEAQKHQPWDIASLQDVD